MSSTNTTISGGWIRLYRQALDNGWLRNHRLWAFWCYCILKASHKPAKAIVGFQQVSLEAGQFIFGRHQAASDLDLSENTIRTCLTRLISTGNLTIKSTNKFSIITIVNWHSYQNGQEENHQQNHQQLNQQVTNKSPTSHHIQEVKNVRKESIPPSIEEVIAYCMERKRGVDPHKWFNHYEAKGWMIGKNKMKNWKAAVRTWEKNEPAQSQIQQDIPSFMTDPAFNEDSYDAA